MMEVLQYHPSEWDKAFLSEKDNLLFLLPQFKFNVEHIGATSIPNCRSFRNVDILLSLNRFEDILTVAMLLNSKDYKEIKELSSVDCVVLTKRTKVNGCGITLRVVEYASLTYNRFIAFKTLLRESFDKTQKYNLFRETLFKESDRNISKYNQVKYDYINSVIDENYKFE